MSLEAGDASWQCPQQAKARGRALTRAPPYQGQKGVPGVRRAGSWEIREVQHPSRTLWGDGARAVGATAHLSLQGPNELSTYGLSRQEQMLWGELPEIRFDLCVLENSISVLYQFPLLTRGGDERINLARSRSPRNIMIKVIIQPCPSLPNKNSPTVPSPLSQERAQ